MAKRPVEKYDFKAFLEAVKAVRTGRKESRKKVNSRLKSIHLVYFLFLYFRLLNGAGVSFQLPEYLLDTFRFASAILGYFVKPLQFTLWGQ